MLSGELICDCGERQLLFALSCIVLGFVFRHLNSREGKQTRLRHKLILDEN